ncbi:beta-lactamase-like protein [Mycena amicta]|nr:beta-lactamase-like protein [Mycena amicta]
MSPPSTEVIFLGTGTSSSVPHIDCITAHAIPGSSERPPCRTCLSTIDGSPEGHKNVRRNTSLIVRTPGANGSVTLLIDCGKNFQAAALEWFPKYSLRRIDAVLITHAHSDAINGLDDLRAWTLSSRIQPHIDIYTSDATFQDIKRTFPYLVSKELASGGGDVPQFVWHVCVQDGVPFEILNTSVMVTPFLVNHGRLFTAPAPAPTSEGAKAEVQLEEIIQPFMCMAFRIQEDLVYISDCGAIPDAAWTSIIPSNNNQLPVCILDCLHLRSHPSHFGLEQSILAARRIAAKRTYLLGFSHEVAHDEYVTMCEAVGGAAVAEKSELTENEVKGLGMIGEGEPIWIRPAHDGLKIWIPRTEEGAVSDETYR